RATASRCRSPRLATARRCRRLGCTTAARRPGTTMGSYLGPTCKPEGGSIPRCSALLPLHFFYGGASHSLLCHSDPYVSDHQGGQCVMDSIGSAVSIFVKSNQKFIHLLATSVAVTLL
uniref:Uncharacterized protein n=1 Tax=Aegilops tauschii subsp. strangulata TaxID=200361 RepID=A0A453EFU1_AEGTS